MAFFFSNEISDISSESLDYFKRPAAIIQVVTITFSVVCIIYYTLLVLNYWYINFTFPMTANVEDEETVFRRLLMLASRSETFNTLLSFNTCLVFSRCVMLMSRTAPDAAIFFNMIEEAKKPLLSFFLMCGVMLYGFTLSSFYLFAQSTSEFRKVEGAFLNILMMVMGSPNFDICVNGDIAMGMVFFFVFHVFNIVVLQLFLSTLIVGYDTAKGGVDDDMGAHADEYPLIRFLISCREWIKDSTSVISATAGSLRQVLFGSSSSGAIKINHEKIASLRDGRVSMPKVRMVVYEKKPQEAMETDAANTTIKDDVTLKVRKPRYRKGKMHYVVDTLKDDGPAKEAKVQEDFRLVKIIIQNLKTDSFRDPQKKEGAKYMDNPQAILEDLEKHLPVTLEFHGQVDFFTSQCVLFLTILTLLNFFVVWVARIPDTFEMVTMQTDVYETNTWYDFEPLTVVGMNDITYMEQVNSWLDASLVKAVFECTSTLSDYGTCREDTDVLYTRPEWTRAIQGFSGDNNEVIEEFGFNMSVSTPDALKGYSAAYIPWNYQANSVAQTTIQVLPLVKKWNVGVMSNNHVRMTLQFACYEENTDKRYKSGYRTKVGSVTYGVNCATSSCMKDILESGGTCLDKAGEPLDLSSFYGSDSGMEYKFAEDGTYKDLGGVSLGLGNTQEEARFFIQLLKEDNIMASAVSVVVETVTYNANYDLFTFSAAEFSLRETGQVNKNVNTVVFPLNIFSTGPNLGEWQLALSIVCLLYIITSMYFSIYFFYDFFIVQFAINSRLQQPMYMFPFEFFKDDWVNLVDSAYIIVNIVMLVYLSEYMFFQGHMKSDFSVWSWTRNEKDFDVDVGSYTVDEFSEFAHVAEVYSRFVSCAAVTTLFCTIRLTKFFNAVESLRLLVSTFITALIELLVMVTVLVFLMYGCTLLFYVQFAKENSNFATMLYSFIELFLFMVGQFDAYRELYEDFPVYFTCIFSIYQVGFFFIFSNVFVSVLVYQWGESRKDAQKSHENVQGHMRLMLCKNCLPRVHGAGDQKNKVKLDKEFWRESAALNWIDKVDDRGVIVVPPEDPKNADAVAVRDREEDTVKRANVTRKRFEQVFNMAHMEIASNLAKSSVDVTDPSSVDRGAGVGSGDGFPIDGGDDAGAAETQQQGGIQSNPVNEEKAKSIKLRVDRLMKKLNDKDNAEEVWLDALVTVLEDSDALQELQEFYMPPAMIRPKKTEDYGEFSKRRKRMGDRLHTFLLLLEEITKQKSYEFLKERAACKERVLKQQSLVLMEYLQNLNDQITKLDEEIADFEAKSSKMRQHVSPLL